MIKKIVAAVGISVVAIGGVLGGSLYALNNAYESRVAMEKNAEVANAQSQPAQPEVAKSTTPVVSTPDVAVDESTVAEAPAETAPFVFRDYIAAQLTQAGVTADPSALTSAFRMVYGLDWDQNEADTKALVSGILKPGAKTLEKAGVIDSSIDSTARFYAVRDYVVTSGEFYRVGINGVGTLKQ